MKDIIVKLLGSAAKSSAVATILAIVAYLTDINVLMTFTIAFAGQFVFFYLYNSYLEFKSVKFAKEQQLKEIEILSRITFTVPCAACKKNNEVVINANTDNNFECEHCGVKNAVYVSVESALVTTPINTEI